MEEEHVWTHLMIRSCLVAGEKRGTPAKGRGEGPLENFGNRQAPKVVFIKQFSGLWKKGSEGRRDTLQK